MIFSEFYKYSFFQQIPILSNKNNKRFALSADGAGGIFLYFFFFRRQGLVLFPLERENGQLFSLFERKKVAKKKQTTSSDASVRGRLDGLSSLGIAPTKARSLFANACASADYSLGERNFAACGSLSL